MKLQALIDAIPTVIGVFLGGGITFFTQYFMKRREDNKKRESDKLRAYNEILRLEENTPLEHSVDNREYRKLDWMKYIANSRNILLENLHLFDKEIIEKVLLIEDTAAEAKFIAYDYPLDQDNYEYYNDIIKYIRKDYKSIINSKT